MQTPTITYPAELQTALPRRSSRRERLAAEHLKNTYQALLSDANRLRTQIRTAENNFNYLADEKEIDACIYLIRTHQCRFASTLSKMQLLKARMQNLLDN